MTETDPKPESLSAQPESPDPPGSQGSKGGERVDFPCENCGAPTRWDPVEDALHCEYCSHRTIVPRDEGVIVERALEDAGEAARGLGLELRVSRCGTCGAQVTFDEASTAESCIYCGSSNVLDQASNRNTLRPESVVPLDVGRAQVEERFRRWLRRLWFRPNDLKRTKRFDAVGVYVPFWTFDCQVHSDWSADAGYHYYVTETYTTVVNGKPQIRTRMVQRTRWEPAWGQRDDGYDDLLVNASQGLRDDLLKKLGGFDTSELVPYRPEYLAGWRAEEYQVDLEQGWDRGQAAVVEQQSARCGSDVPGDTYRNLRVKNHIRDVRWKHVLLPLWSLQYRYGGKVYTVLVNGQSGTVSGDAPYSWVKILLLVLGILAAVLFVGVFVTGCGAVAAVASTL